MIEYTKKDKPRINKRTVVPKIGTKFGRFTIIDDAFYGLKSYKHNHMKCQCDCGFIAFERLDMLTKGIRTGCYECSHTHRIRDYKEIGNLSSLTVSNIKRNAKIRNLEFNISMQFLWDLFLKQEGKCALSGIDIKLINIKKEKCSASEISASLDRIDSSKGYTEENVQWVHKAINILKGSLNNSEFINICKFVSLYNANYHDNFEPSQLKGYMKRFLYKTTTRSKLEGATHSE